MELIASATSDTSDENATVFNGTVESFVDKPLARERRHGKTVVHRGQSVLLVQILSVA